MNRKTKIMSLLVACRIAIASGFVVMIFGAPATALGAPGRWALVIGNNDYVRVETLRNAVADARLIAAELADSGFEVRTLVNADRRTTLREVLELARRAEGGGEAVLYWAGHGVQLANTNYLLPVDFHGDDPAMLIYEAISLTDIGNALLDAKTRFSLIIVDACRNNPIVGPRGRSMTGTSGLAPVSPATGQMIVFAAGSGQVALDGMGPPDKARNGIFAREFAKEIRRPDRDVREVMLAVRESVERLAASVNHAQRPAIYDESRGRFVFRPSPTISSLSAPALPVGSRSDVHPVAPEIIEDEIWATVSRSNSPAAFEAYLREYPRGRYAAAARIRSEMLAGARSVPILPESRERPLNSADLPAEQMQQTPTSVEQTTHGSEPPTSSAAVPGKGSEFPGAVRNLTVGAKMVALGTGAWVEVEEHEFKLTASFSAANQLWDPAGNTSEVTAIRKTALEVDGKFVGSIFVIATNITRESGFRSWPLDSCKPQQKGRTEHLSSDVNLPECLNVRKLGSREAASLPEFAVAFARTAASRITIPSHYFLVVYARFTSAGFIDVSVLIPASEKTDEAAAVSWGRDLAKSLRPLAEKKVPIKVALPDMR